MRMDVIDGRRQLTSQCLIAYVPHYTYDLAKWILPLHLHADLFAQRFFARQILAHKCLAHDETMRAGFHVIGCREVTATFQRNAHRSEEHTSELQSRGL